MRFEDLSPVGEAAIYVLSTGLAAAISAATTATGVAIVRGTGWTLESVDLTENDLIKAGVLGGTVVTAGILSVRFLLNRCGINKAVESFMQTAGTILSGFAVPAGGAMLNKLNSGPAAGYAFTVGTVGPAATIAGLLCLVGCGYCFVLCLDGANNLNVIKIPEGEKDKNGNPIIKLPDLEKGEIIPIQEILPEIASNKAALEVLEKSGINIGETNTNALAARGKNLYLPQSGNKLVNIDFKDIRVPQDKENSVSHGAQNAENKKTWFNSLRKSG